ncbi:4-hydroxybenzoate octaprenyltransferase [Pleionea sp. CnH1-48]|nr:4-hydroxybenzoate octaprenyltransferase [Pleionea sp. CnH1-48]
MRMDRPIGTYLLLWPTLWALWLASAGFPEAKLLIIFACGVFLMRSAGCVINDYADRNIDAHVKRTENRPLARRDISEKEALILFVVLVSIAFVLVLFLNPFTIYLSFAAVALAATYPFMKRYTYFPQVVLGAAFAWSIPMAFAAVNQEIAAEAWLLYIATLLWVLAYDTLYGMVDRKYDLKIGVKSTAILFGDADLAITAIIQAFFLFGMLLIGHRFEMGWPYYLGWGVATGLIAYQFWIARKRKPEQCFKAFLNNNYVGMALFIGIAFSL